MPLSAANFFAYGEAIALPPDGGTDKDAAGGGAAFDGVGVGGGATAAGDGLGGGGGGGAAGSEASLLGSWSSAAVGW